MDGDAGERRLRLRRRRIGAAYQQAWSEAGADDMASTPLVRLKDELEDLLVSQQRAIADRDSLTAAWHGALAPRELPRIDGVRLASCYEPSNAHIGGDFYDVAPAPDGRWALALGDVCGKGTAAATSAALVRHSLRTATQMVDDPCRALRVAHEVLVADADPLNPVFCTAAYARLRPAGRGVELRLALAGHPLPLVLRASGAVEPVGLPGMALGLADRPEDLELHEVTVALGPGDLFLAYTDGVTDARQSHQFFGYDRLTDIVASSRDLAPQAVVDCIHRAVVDFRDEAAQDDFAVLALSCWNGAGG